MFKKAVLWIMVLALLLNNGLAVCAMENGSSGTADKTGLAVSKTGEENIKTMDLSDMVYHAGGWGTQQNAEVAVFGVRGAMTQLETEILAAVKGAAEELDVRAYNIYIDDIEMIEVLLADIINSDPELFYVYPYVGYSYSHMGLVDALYFYYDDYTTEQRQEYIKKIRKAQSLVTDEMSDLDKALVLHDYLVQNCSYAYEEYLNGTLNSCGKNVYSAFGALVEGEAVCLGYASAYCAMLEAVGIESEICSSSAMNHAWNLVLIDGEWYHVDPTWNDPVWNTEGYAGHYYFMLSDAEMQNREHYDYFPSNMCTSTKYDADYYWWTAAESQIVWEDGKQYYLAPSNQGFKLVEKDGETFTVKYENDAVWEVWGDPYSYWMGTFSYLSKQGDYIYFNDKVNIYAMSLRDFQPQVVYTYTGGNGYIYGAMVYENGYGRCNISQSPNMDNDDYTVFQLKSAVPNVSVDYDTRRISTTSSMEYSLDNGMTWTPCADNMKIEDFVRDNSSKIKILFRTAAYGLQFASDAVEITVVVYEEKIISNDENGIPDKVLYEYLLRCADASGDGILTEQEAAAYEESISVEGVSRIKGIEYFTSVDSISITNGTVTDITSLGKLRTLKQVSLNNNNISDISILTELVDLELLWAADNEISELPDLKDSKLKVWGGLEMYVDFRGNHISYAEAQQKLPQRFLDDAEWCNIQGFYKQVNSIVLNVNTLEMEVADSYTLTVTVLPADASCKTVNWKSDDETVVTVDETGKVVAVGPGEAKITVTAADDSNVIASCSITVTQAVHQHTEVIDKAVEATCTSTGLTEGKHCSKCNEILIKQQIVKKLDHVYDNNVDGTCNNCGVNRETVEVRQVVHMFRMYNPNTGEHFYTGSTVERDNLIAAGWQYEGVGFTFPANTGVPVHRLFQPSTGEHLYTMDETEKDALIAAGWNYEGIAFNSAYDTEAVQYRLHNPNATCGAYHFTFSLEERQNLLNAGWEDQGIGWYSCWK